MQSQFASGWRASTDLGEAEKKGWMCSSIYWLTWRPSVKPRGFSFAPPYISDLTLVTLQSVNNGREEDTEPR